MCDDSSDEDIQVVEHVNRAASKRKWNAPNPRISTGTGNSILNDVRKKLNMDSSLTLNSPVRVPLNNSRVGSPSVKTPVKANPGPNGPNPLTLTPEQIQTLTRNCLDNVNEPKECESPPQQPSSSKTNVKVSGSLARKPSCYFGAGTSTANAFQILKEGAKNLTKSPKKSPASKKRLSKNSPIRLLPRFVNSKSPRRSPLKSPMKSPSKTSACRSLLPDMDSQDKVSQSQESSGLPEQETQKSSADNPLVPTNGPYYFEAFCFILRKIQSYPNFRQLFCYSECEKILMFNSPSPELKLYVRFMNRMDKWNRVEDIHYRDIADNLIPLFHKLEEEQLIVCDISAEDLDDLMLLLKVKELKELCSTFKLKATTKDDMIRALLVMNKTQPTIGHPSPLRQIVSDRLGYCFRLKTEWRLLFRRCIMLFSMFHSLEDLDKLSQDQALLLLQVKLKKMVFPVNDLKVTQHPEIFMNRDQFIRYEEARDSLQKLNNISSKSDGTALKELTNKTHMQFSALLELHQETEHVLSLPSFLQKYSAGSTYAYVLTRCADEIKKLHEFRLVSTVLRCLLSQNIYQQNRRGRWTLQLCMVLHINLKDNKKAAEECFKGLSDKTFGLVDRMHLQKRAEQILKSLKDKSLQVKLRGAMDKGQSTTQRVEISARLLPSSRPGLKRVYIRDTDDGKEFMSVEEIVREHYKRLGFAYGVHDEGGTIASLCFLLLWDIIYDSALPYAFISPYQDRPLDWSSKQFYETRKTSLECRFADILSKSVEEVSQDLGEAYDNHVGITSMISWSRLEHLQFQAFLKCLTLPTFIAICRRLMQDLKSNRSGFPDLTLWNPDTGKLIFVEVKSPNDCLSTIQSMWLEFLDENGSVAIVANVRDTGSKSKVLGFKN